MGQGGAGVNDVDFPATIPGAIERAVRLFPDVEALVDGAVRWTFAEYGAQIHRGAAAMVASGVEPGDRVAVWAPNGHRWLVAALGAVTAGAVLVPINTRYKGDEARWILDKSRARLLVVDNGFLGNDYLAMLRDGGAGEPGRPVAGLPHLREVVDLAATPDAAAVAWPAFLERASATPPDDVLARAAGVAGADVSDMFFTSGTTGKPKGVLTTHEQNIRVNAAWATGVGLRGGDRYLLVNPMFNTFGYKAGVLASLLFGVTVVSQTVFDVPVTLELIARERISVLPGPPTLYAAILDHPDRARLDLGSLRLAVTGATVVPAALVERVRAELFPVVLVGYGMTETCGTVSLTDPDTDVLTISRTVGRPIPGVEVMIAGPDRRPVPPGESGEVLVRGHNVMLGYFEDPRATASTIDADGWMHTGDVGLFDEHGNLRITDRLKDMFVVGGFNVYPAEVEQAIARHDAVSEVAVIGVPDERLGEVGHAYVIPRSDRPAPTAEEIIAYCRERLANYKVPRGVTVVGDLPRNASGKVLKFQLRAGGVGVSSRSSSDG
jgi:acyl-CoA synthetase (AMP-forming)/AMP-acid ligase II